MYFQEARKKERELEEKRLTQERLAEDARRKADEVRVNSFSIAYYFFAHMSMNAIIRAYAYISLG